MRTLGVDWGKSRVGLAVSDQGGRLATPLEVLSVSSPHDALTRIARVIERQGIERIVVGLPLNMDGSAGPAARDAAAWGRQLGQLCGTSVFFVDERLTSFQAQEILSQRKRAGERLTRKKKKQRLDAVAAAGILQAFLDGTLPAIEA